MKEQSHKNEMGAALRGDFERLRARRGGETGAIEPAAPSPPLVTQPDPAPEPEIVPEPAAPAVESGGSWLERLRGRG